MRRVNLYDLVELGKSLQGMAILSDKSAPVDGAIAASNLRKSLAKIERGELIEFGFIDHNIDQIKQALKNIDERWRGKDKDGNDHDSIGWSARYYSSEAIKAFENVLAAECRTAATYFVSKVGIYSTNLLIEAAADRFSESSHEFIGNDALNQFQEAAQCLCYQLYTACGFHMMRAVEYVFLKYMRLICGRNFSSLNTNWGSYINELENIIKSKARRKPAQNTVDLLRQIKNNHRNPVIHADLVLTADEAKDIFDLGSVVISHLADQISRMSGARVKAT
jgi:hypothetical protein